MGKLILQITTKRDDATLKSTFETAGGKQEIANRIVNYVTSVLSGGESAQDSSTPPSIAISVQGQATRASGTVTFSAVASADDTVIVNGVTFTAKASGATGNQFNIGASATASAANLAAAINASASAMVSQQVTASPALGVVTIYSTQYGVAGNSVTLAEGVDSGGVISVSGAYLTGGAADPYAQTLSF